MRLTVLLALLVPICTWAQSSSSRCLDSQKLQSILTRYAFEIWNPSAGPQGAWTRLTEADPCDMQSAPAQIAQALIFIEAFPDSSTSADDFDQQVLAPSVRGFFQSRIHTILFEPVAQLTCSPQTLAYVQNTATESKTMHVCPFLTEFSTQMIAATLMHESRHIDGYPHAVCKSGIYVSAFACDDSYETHGSYGVGVEFDVKTWGNEGVSPAVRQEARAAAVADFLVRFNEEPLGISEGALLFGNDRVLSFFDGVSALPLTAPLAESVRITLRDVPGIFDTADGSVSGFTGAESLTALPGPFAQEFRDMPRDRQRRLMDVLYGPVACFLFEDLLHCEQGGDVIEWPLPADLHPVQFMALSIPARGSAFIVGNADDVWQLPTSSVLKNWNPSQLIKSDIGSLARFKSLISLQKTKRFAIDREGRLLSAPTPQSDWRPTPGLENRLFQKMLAPYFWSSRLRDL